MNPEISDVALSEEARRLYLNYALSVITARALPDVRDGLKPVQRRILFAMHHELHLRPDGKPAKCARIVGDVIGKYHPHGDTAIYDALVRMAQDWVMRVPLVEGQGNFGSIDGDAAAAYRYTEARLQKIAVELLLELKDKTVDYRPTFDATRFEPVVLPARFPNLLVNGAQGIAVGMATSIPPHNLGEVSDALVALIDDRDASLPALLRRIKGPDFPTGGELLSSKAELRKIYETGQGSVRVRGQWKTETTKGSTHIVITSIPYSLEKQSLVEKIADVIIRKKLPSLTDVRDESTDTIRIVLEIQKSANPELVMAYLMKHTPLMNNVGVNLTCLIPTENRELTTPARLGLREILLQFLEFRFEVVTKRLEHELKQNEDRLHVLEGLEQVFDALDEIIRIIRRSDGKQDAQKSIMKKFGIDEVQTDAILELKLYRLAKLEILLIRKEADEKRSAVKRLRGLLKSPTKRWKVVRDEIMEIRYAYKDKRRTKVLGAVDEPEFSAEDFIHDEDSMVIVTRRGWVKRQQTVRDLASTRTKDGDYVLACLGGSTKATVLFFSTHGYAYVTRIADLPSSTGYGDPLQKYFKFDDGEGIVGALSLDPRMIQLPEEATDFDGTPMRPYAVAITEQGMALRFPLAPHREPSTRAGRRFMRLNDGDRVLSAFCVEGSHYLIACADDGHALAVAPEEVPLLAGPGKGATLIKLAKNARLIGAAGAPSLRVGPLVVKTEKGKEHELFAESLLGKRAGRGKQVVKRSKFQEVVHFLPEIPTLNGGTA